MTIKRFGSTIKNPMKMREIIAGYGTWGYLFFFLLYIFQIFFAPVPGNVLNVSSGILFGLLKGIILSWGAVILGGSLTMAFSRIFGEKVLNYLLDEKARNFQRVITRKGISFILFLAIFPNPVGDGVYYLAGVTDAPLKVLIPLVSLGRLPGIIVSVLIGDKILTTGIKGWIIGGAGFLLAVLLYIIFGKKFEVFFEKVLKKEGS